MGSWLKENERPVIGLVLVIGGMLLFFLAVLLPPERVNKDVVLMTLGAMNTILSIIIGYHWGSSASSGKKDDLQAKLLLKEDKPCLPEQ